MATVNSSVPVSPESVKAAEGLKKAMKGMGTDEKALIEYLCKRPANEVAAIAHTYKAHYAKDLAEEVEKETKGDFGKLMVRLCMGPLAADCSDLNDALYPPKDGADPDKEALVEILCGRTNAELRAIRDEFQRRYGVPLIDAIKSVLKKDFEQFMTVLLGANRDESGAYNDVNGDCEALYKAGTGKFGTDEDAFIAIICNRSIDHLAKVFTAYEARYKMPMEKVIKKEFTGSLELGLLTMVRLIQNRPAAIARQFEDSMAGIGTNETKLARLATRYRDPSIMNVVEAEYQKEYKKTLTKRIEGETSGDFKKALIAIVSRA